MRILLLGANGQVGWELQRSLATLGKLLIHRKDTADFQNSNVLTALVKKEKPDIIVNAAAYTAVDRAETDEELAYQVNAEAVKALAESAKKIDASLIHYSTDYVFDGTKTGSYSESDSTNPQSIYGKSKRAGELAIIDSGCKYFILRTSWVFASRGSNFAKIMIKLACERDELKVVADQIGAPTSAELIADVTAQLVYQHRQHRTFSEQYSGIYNLVASGQASWYDFAKRVLEQASALGLTLRVKPADVAAINTADFPRPAVRPANSCLDNQKLQSLLDISLPDWQFHVDRMVTEFLESQS